MIELKYIASSGNEYNLKAKDRLRSRQTNYHTWRYIPQGTKLKYGTRVSIFTKDAAEYTTQLVFSGSVENRAKYIDKLHTDIERDILHLTPGRIVWGGWYIECFLNVSSTYPDPNNDGWTNNDLTIYCPRPYWIKEAHRDFMSAEGSAPEDGFLDYDFDYLYDFTGGEKGVATWERDFPFGSKFRMSISGPAVNPSVRINGHLYQVLNTLGSGENIIIDSRNNTIIKQYANNTSGSIFDDRNKIHSVFEDIPAGNLTLSWTGDFAFSLTLFEERSEPSWS